MRWLLLLLFAALPLQWIVVPLPLVNQRIHIVVMVLVAAIGYLRFRSGAFRAVVLVSWPFLAGMVVLVATWLATALYHHESPLDPLEACVQALVFVSLGTAIHKVAVDDSGRGMDVLRWAATVCSLTLIAALGISMSLNAVDPVAVFTRTVATGDPNVLQRELFKFAFVGLGYDDTSVKANFRHEIFAAVLVSLYMSAAATRLRPFTSTFALWLSRFFTLVSFLLLLVSLGRSLIIAAVLGLGVGVVRVVESQRIRVDQLFAGAGIAAVLAALGWTGFLSVLWIKFTQDTTSYQNRDGLLQLAFQNILAHGLTGGVNTTGGESSHNFILDAWLRSGIAGALAALWVSAVLLGLLLSMLGRLSLEPAWMVPTLGALCLVLVRMFTAGGGTIPPVEWVALAVVVGLMALRQDRVLEAHRDRAGASSSR